MKTQLYRLCSILISLLTWGYSSAQPGTLDSLFGINGITITNIGLGDAGIGIALQENGNIMMAGQSGEGFTLLCYQTDGLLDPTFGSDGIVTTQMDGWASAMASQADGKIIVAGQTSSGGTDPKAIYLVRYQIDGTLDPSFGLNGIVITPYPHGSHWNVPHVHDMAIQPDGKIVLTGDDSTGVMIMRYNLDGSLDNTFSQDGILTNIGIGLGETVAIQPDGKIVVGGPTGVISPPFDFFILRFNVNGTPDLSFGDNGRVITSLGSDWDVGRDLVLQPDGKIVIAGETNTVDHSFDYAVLRYLPDGNLDQSFGINGISVIVVSDYQDSENAIALQPDGKILLTGSTRESNDAVLVRLNDDGSPDSSFGINGIVKTPVPRSVGADILLQPDGKILVGGTANYIELIGGGDFMILRYISGLTLGVVDQPQAEHPFFIYPNPIDAEFTIEYALLNDQPVSVLLYDRSGMLVQTLMLDEPRSKGSHQETFILDQKIPAGAYLMTIRTPEGSVSIWIVR